MYYEIVSSGRREYAVLCFGQQLLDWMILVVALPQRVNDPLVGQVKTRGDNGLARPDGRQRPAGPGQFEPGGAMQRAGHAAARLQLRIGCVDHGLKVLLTGNVALNTFNAGCHDVYSPGKRYEHKHYAAPCFSGWRIMTDSRQLQHHARTA